MSRKQALETLGLSGDPSKAEITAAWRKLARQHHPNSGDGDTARFHAARLAYALLVDKPAPEPDLNPDFEGWRPQPPRDPWDGFVILPAMCQVSSSLRYEYRVEERDEMFVIAQTRLVETALEDAVQTELFGADITRQFDPEKKVMVSSGGSCPYCDRRSMIVCRCKAVYCAAVGKANTCPSCGKIHIWGGDKKGTGGNTLSRAGYRLTRRGDVVPRPDLAKLGGAKR